WALYIAFMSLADLVFQSTMIMLAKLGPITFKPRLVRKSTVMARFWIISLRRAAISAVWVMLAVAQAVVGIEGPLPRSYTSTFFTRSGRAITYPTRAPAMPNTLEKVRVMMTSLPARTRWA